MSKTARILLVEDEEIIALILADLLDSQGHKTTVCFTAQTAWEKLQSNPDGYDIVLLDRQLPDMDGLELLRRIKQDPALNRIPIIFETALDDKHCIREGLDNGAYYYLTKPIQPELLLAAISAAFQHILDVKEMMEKIRSAERPLSFMHSGCFRFRDLEEAKCLANFLARACPEPERAILGLHELFINAVEHGNLDLSYSDKSALIAATNWQEEVNRRLQLPKFKDRYVEVRFERLAECFQFTIIDQGQGFDWRDFLDFSTERAFDLHGRGIALAGKLSFESLTYLGCGNSVVATFKPAEVMTG